MALGFGSTMADIALALFSFDIGVVGLISTSDSVPLLYADRLSAERSYRCGGRGTDGRAGRLRHQQAGAAVSQRGGGNREKFGSMFGLGHGALFADQSRGRCAGRHFDFWYRHDPA